MGLNNDLAVLFAKTVNSNNKTNTESTVFGTVTKVYAGKAYVQQDGSDLLTPASITADVEVGERVAVLIKNHTATVMGNLSSPSARTDTVNELGASVDDVVDQISEFEIVIADKVSSKEFDAQVGRIDDLQADNVVIHETVSANTALVNDIKAANVVISERLNASEASITLLNTTKLNVATAKATYATIDNLEATNADIHNLEATYADFEVVVTNRLDSMDAKIDNLDVGYATIEELEVERARIDIIEAGQMGADSAYIKELQSDIAEINTLIFGSASGDVIQASFSNAVIASMSSAQIKSAMIESIHAAKITAGDIITNNVRVKSEDGKLLISDETLQISDNTRVRVQIGKDANNDYSINIWDASGNLMFSEGGISDSAIKDAIIRDDMVSDTANISAHKLNIESLFEEINGSTKTINSTRVYLNSESQTLDVAFESMGSYIGGISTEVTNQGTAIPVIQGQINNKVWQQDIDDASGLLNTKYSSLQQTADSMNLVIADHTTELSEKADSREVESIQDQVTAVETSLVGFKTTVSSTYAKKSELSSLQVEADGIAARVTAAEQDIGTALTNAANAQSKIDDLEIGGRNLVRDSDLYSDTDMWSYDYSHNTISFANGYLEIQRIYDENYTSRTFGTQYNNMNPLLLPDEISGETYVISADLKAIDGVALSANSSIFWRVYNDNGTTYQEVSLSIPTDLSSSEWRRCYAVKTFETRNWTNSQLSIALNNATSGFCVRNIMLEKATKPSAWSQAQEDMASAKDVEYTQNSVDEVKEIAVRAETLIQQLSDAISMLVTDGNGTSLMTQTENGWMFSTSEIQTSINNASAVLDTLTTEMGDTKNTVGILSQAVADLGVLNDYVKIGTYENEPCIELGESDSDFKLLITNTRIMFMEGSGVPAYLNNQSLFIKKAVIEEELQQGQFVWKARANGNLGLIWKGAAS